MSLTSGPMLIGMAMQLCIAGSVAGGQGMMGSVPAASFEARFGVAPDKSDSPIDSVRRRRPRAIEYGDWYARRLTVHRIGSYAMLPLFGTQYYLGQKLINGEASGSERSLHVGVATAIGGLFAVNTITGVWNLWDSRKDPTNRTRRLIHAGLMLGADAGFTFAAAAAGDDDSRHKTIALSSIGISTVGAAMMWFWKN